MKSWLRKAIFSICSGCLAFSFYFATSGVSMLFFGEPESPFED